MHSVIQFKWLYLQLVASNFFHMVITVPCIGLGHRPVHARQLWRCYMKNIYATYIHQYRFCIGRNTNKKHICIVHSYVDLIYATYMYIYGTYKFLEYMQHICKICVSYMYIHVHICIIHFELGEIPTKNIYLKYILHICDFCE